MWSEGVRGNQDDSGSLVGDGEKGKAGGWAGGGVRVWCASSVWSALRPGVCEASEWMHQAGEGELELDRLWPWEHGTCLVPHCILRASHSTWHMAGPG